MFVCHKSLEELKASYPNSYNYIKKWESHPNKVGISLEKANRNVKPYWYSVKKEFADILPQININQRAFTPYSPTPVFVNQRLVYINARDKNDAVLISALLNSILSLLNIEFNGIPRFLGSLDLNANFFKTKIKILNPNLINDESKERIIKAFIPVSERDQLDYDQEFTQADRKNYDEVVFREFGFDIGLVPKLYELLIKTMVDRIEMKNR